MEFLWRKNTHRVLHSGSKAGKKIRKLGLCPMWVNSFVACALGFHFDVDWIHLSSEIIKLGNFPDFFGKLSKIEIVSPAF